MTRWNPQSRPTQPVNNARVSLSPVRRAALGSRPPSPGVLGAICLCARSVSRFPSQHKERRRGAMPRVLLARGGVAPVVVLRACLFGAPRAGSSASTLVSAFPPQSPTTVSNRDPDGFPKVWREVRHDRPLRGLAGCPLAGMFGVGRRAKRGTLPHNEQEQLVPGPIDRDLRCTHT